MRIIVKKPDSGIVVIMPNLDKYGEGKKPFSECKGLKPYIELGYEWFVTDEDIDKSDLESRKQLYCEGETIKKDHKWEKRLMPNQLIKKKHLARQGLKLESELKLDTPDPIKAVKLQHDIDSKKNIDVEDNMFWSQIALANMDEDGIDKPGIREKLNEQISK